MALPVMHVFRNYADKLSHETGRIRSRVRPAVQGCIKEDVYKRQGVGEGYDVGLTGEQWHCVAVVAVQGEMVGPDTLAHVAVSYTHLDVYKRQGGLVLKVARNGPVDRHIGEGGLPPAGGNVQVVHKAADVLLDRCV